MTHHSSAQRTPPTRPLLAARPCPARRPPAAGHTSSTGGTPRARFCGLAAAALSAAVLTGCAATAEADAAASPSTDPHARPTAEAGGPQTRLAITYDGGVMVLDEDHEVIADLPAAGFTRLNAAGDNRHVFLTEGEAFRLLDLGTWSEPHGDHAHAYTTDPLLSEQRIEGEHPGHLVAHDGTAAAFFDGTGTIHTFDPLSLDAGEAIESQTVQTAAAHHGVAVVRGDGSMIQTVGTEDARSGVRILDASGSEAASTGDCPGVHGEAAAAGGIITLGCEDGLVIIEGATIRKFDSPDEYGRIGNQRGHADSPIVLGDYKTDPDAEVERPTRITLTDVRSGELRLVDLPAAYSFRSLGRGPGGEVLVHGTDGTLRVIDPGSGETVAEVPVTAAWEEPADWQDPQPSVHTAGDAVYVTEPAASALHRIDLSAGTVAETVELPHTPGEIASATGEVPEGARDGEGHGEHAEDGHEHGHEDHDHGHGDHDHGEHDGHSH